MLTKEDADNQSVGVYSKRIGGLTGRISKCRAIGDDRLVRTECSTRKWRKWHQWRVTKAIPLLSIGIKDSDFRKCPVRWIPWCDPTIRSLKINFNFCHFINIDCRWNETCFNRITFEHCLITTIIVNSLAFPSIASLQHTYQRQSKSCPLFPPMSS